MVFSSIKSQQTNKLSQLAAGFLLLFNCQYFTCFNSKCSCFVNGKIVARNRLITTCINVYIMIVDNYRTIFFRVFTYPGWVPSATSSKRLFPHCICQIHPMIHCLWKCRLIPDHKGSKEDKLRWHHSFRHRLVCHEYSGFHTDVLLTKVLHTLLSCVCILPRG